MIFACYTITLVVSSNHWYNSIRKVPFIKKVIVINGKEGFYEEEKNFKSMYLV